MWENQSSQRIYPGLLSNSEFDPSRFECICNKKTMANIWNYCSIMSVNPVSVPVRVYLTNLTINTC